MKLNELKQGMVCELRNGNLIKILNDGLFKEDGLYYTIKLNEVFNDNLAHKNNKSFDIVKVIYYTNLYTSGTGGIYYNKSRV